MRPKSVMLIAGEPSGDTLGAELVEALRKELTAAEVEYTTDTQPLRTGLEPRFFGAGGPRMAAAGVELAFDLTEHSIIGFPTLKSYLQARRRFNELLKLAFERQPDVIVGVDYNYFNLRFAEAVRQYTSRNSGWFHDWHPKLVKYVSPQVWASREDRAYPIARDFDLLLSIFPFEKDWYARRVPKLHVEFVGHPMVERFLKKSTVHSPQSTVAGHSPQILLLPGSRMKELHRHLPVMLRGLGLIQEKITQTQAKIVLPDESLASEAKSLGVPSGVKIQIGNLSQALAESDLAIASTGTVTMECAFFGVPAVTLYKTSWVTYEIGKRIVKVKSLTMPNLLADEEVFPEFIQNAATPENISRAALELLQNEERRKSIKAKLAKIVSSLGGPGASERAARAITRLLDPQSSTHS
ncbi:MAG TPA: lipid-A-disaccharide synthase [Verrucomicrobiae bacterium]|nr:lipid-A-disaccharide synthase [Verrucomicrobiae bacterium]